MRNFKNLLRLSWSFFYRDLKAGELTLLSMALILSVASVTTVSFFIDRVEQGIRLQSSQLLAADLVVSSSRPVHDEHIVTAKKLGLQTTQTQNFRTVAVANNNTLLVEIKAVETGYPLRGDLRITDKLFANDHITQDLPQPGVIWVEPRYLQLAGLRVGDAVSLGARSFRIGAVLTFEPDRAGEFFSLAPRILMALSDVAATKLIVPGSINNYKLLLADKQNPNFSQLDVFIESFNRQKKTGEELIQVSKGRPELRFAFERADYFLNLVALICIALSALAIAMTASRYSQRHYDMFALMRCMGYTQGKIISTISFELLWMLLMTSIIGTVIGYLLQFGLSEILGRLLLADLPAPTLQPLSVGAITATVALIGFALPPLWLLKKTPPMRVLQRHLSVESNKIWLMLSVVAAFVLLYLWQLGQSKTTYYLLAGIMATIAALFCAAYVLVKFIKLINLSRFHSIRFGVANITHRARASAVQSMAFGVGIFVLLFLVVLQGDILSDWKKSLPLNTPNYFMVNIQKEQISPLQAFYRENDLHELQIFPMIRARLIAINNKPVSAADYDNPRAQHMVNREFNLSWLEKQQSGNSIIAGHWWTKAQHKQQLISLDAGIAKTLKIWVDDILRYDIAGQEFNLKVSSIRAVEWNSFQANFFAVVPPGLLQDYPANWITSTYIPHDKKNVLVELIRTFPNVTLIDIDSVIQRIRTVVEKVSVALEYMFGFTLLAGMLIMWAAIQSTIDERNKQVALMRTFGATTRQLQINLFSEFVILGGMSGMIGGFAATILAYLLALNVFKFDYAISPVVGLYGIISGLVVVSIIGYLGTRRVLNQSPIKTFRQS